jgi:hypothetical protein
MTRLDGKPSPFNQTHSTASYFIIIHWVDYSLVLFKAHGGVCREQCDTIIKFLGTNHTSLFLTKYSKYLTFQCFDITNIKQSTYEMTQVLFQNKTKIKLFI